jgi:hypothetical protein
MNTTTTYKPAINYKIVLFWTILFSGFTTLFFIFDWPAWTIFLSPLPFFVQPLVLLLMRYHLNDQKIKSSFMGKNKEIDLNLVTRIEKKKSSFVQRFIFAFPAIYLVISCSTGESLEVVNEKLFDIIILE